MDPKEMSKASIEREMEWLDRELHGLGLTSEEEDRYDDLKIEWRRRLRAEGVI